jgi:hypothetical protein
MTASRTSGPETAGRARAFHPDAPSDPGCYLQGRGRLRRRRTSRTARLLETRLEALAQACERSSSPQGRFGEQVFRVVGATRNAVALELLSAEEAATIWAEVRTRHPSADWCRLDADIAA